MMLKRVIKSQRNIFLFEQKMLIVTSALCVFNFLPHFCVHLDLKYRCYKGSFFPQTIRDWNALPDSLISSAEDAEDCVAKFTSLVRGKD